MPVRRTRRRGRGTVGDIANQLNDLAKKTKIISEGLKLIPYAPAQTVAGMAGTLGYGRRRRRPARRGRGFGWIGDIFGNIAKPFAGGIIGATGGLANGLGQIGHGIHRRRRRVR